MTGCAAPPTALDDLPSERHSQLLYEVVRRVVATLAQERSGAAARMCGICCSIYGTGSTRLSLRLAPIVAYEVLNGAQASQLVGEVRDLYAEVLAEPPYLEGPQDVVRFVEHFAEEMTRPGFSLIRAADGLVLMGIA